MLRNWDIQDIYLSIFLVTKIVVDDDGDGKHVVSDVCFEEIGA